MRNATFNKTKRTNSCEHCPHVSNCLPSRMQSSIDTFQFPAKQLKRGEHLSYQGQSSQHLFILRAGILKSYLIKPNGEEFVMGFYLPSDLFGWEAIDESQRSISITALDQSNICLIPTEKIFLLTQENPAFCQQLLRMVSRRIQQDNVALLRTSAQQRVATFILQLELRYRQLGFPKQTLQLLMTHQDIANYLRMTPNTICRIFHEWQQKKIIKIEKHLMRLLDMANINLMAECI